MRNKVDSLQYFLVNMIIKRLLDLGKNFWSNLRILSIFLIMPKLMATVILSWICINSVFCDTYHVQGNIICGSTPVENADVLLYDDVTSELSIDRSDQIKSNGSDQINRSIDQSDQFQTLRMLRWIKSRQTLMAGSI